MIVLRNTLNDTKVVLPSVMNPCPCGYYGSTEKSCHCSSPQIQKYRNKISGPLLDRIDIHVELSDIKADDLFAQNSSAEPSSAIAARVEGARRIQEERFRGEKVFFNSHISHRKLHSYCVLDEQAKDIIRRAMKHFGFSARAYDKILKVSRTIADLAGRAAISAEDISEAIQYRSLDKNLWV